MLQSSGIQLTCTWSPDTKLLAFGGHSTFTMSPPSMLTDIFITFPENRASETIPFRLFCDLVGGFDVILMSSGLIAKCILVLVFSLFEDLVKIFIGLIIQLSGLAVIFYHVTVQYVHLSNEICNENRLRIGVYILW